MIVCAAIKIFLISPLTGRPYPCDDGIVIAGLRHANCYETIRDLKMPHNGYDHELTVEGFINHRGDFLTREEAFEHALVCGQLPAQIRGDKGQVGEHQLFSEDLY